MKSIFIILQHDMKYYNLMVLRSYLDRPERYSLPSNQLSGLQQMMMLQPSLKRAELHEYPKEQVLVLEGENLWFSFKIVLDEGGTNEYIISHPHNATKLSLQFNFSTSRNVSTAIKDEGKVKITLHTHFMTKVMDSVECKKVGLFLYFVLSYVLFVCIFCRNPTAFL